MAETNVTGILWWKPKQWEKAKQISSDSHAFDETYQDWKNAAERALKNFNDLGFKVYKIEIDLDELVQWAQKKKIPLDSKARSEFVYMKVQKHHKSQSN
ncbi:hypothetical protein [Gracilimonas tropica]|uniref:hypothetical protein n=1 Tax=Gracilimonas tropica TaxID=454600 RepID=UPI0003608FD1|nr:hypothetical protein [Gracilimonas tropica]